MKISLKFIQQFFKKNILFLKITILTKLDFLENRIFKILKFKMSYPAVDL